jgi:CheY-like chemotaxis protein
VKLLIEMHGGTVEAKNASSEDDNIRGAEFIVRLPANVADPAASKAVQLANSRAPAPQDKQRPMRILVVDDNIDAADSVALLLTIDGFEARSVHSAMAALDKVDSYEPDVILLDIGLPVMDGFEVAKRLRARIPAEKMRIVALSGYGQQAARDRAAQAGFDHYLVKPVEPTVLSDFLLSLR